LHATAALEKPGVIESIDIQISVFGTKGDKLVSPEAIVEFTERMPFADLKMYNVEVAHEILRERDDVREDALSLIDFFLGTL
jgi:lysophospholipase